MMKKPTRKKNDGDKCCKIGAAEDNIIVQREGGQGVVNKQPQVQQQAAVAHGMFLYTDDAWSLRYFDPNDLHFKEREVFG